jgi:Na+/melibiose symporter-like transporter
MLEIPNLVLEIINIGVYMQKFSKEIIISLLAIIIFAVLWFVNSEPVSWSKIPLLGGVIMLLLVFSLIIAIKKKKERDAGIPEEDEMLKRIKVLAAAKAFQYSMFLWLIIFNINNIFESRMELIGVGILGAGAIYGLLLLHYKRQGISDEE